MSRVKRLNGEIFFYFLASYFVNNFVSRLQKRRFSRLSWENGEAIFNAEMLKIKPSVDKFSSVKILC